MRWKGPVFQVSALAREGLDPMVQAIYEHVAAHKVQAPPEVDPRFDAPPPAKPEEPLDD
jgi:GTP-binding protein